MKNADQLQTGKKPAPGELAFVQGFVNTTDVDSGCDDFATPEGLAAWLERHGLARAPVAVTEAERQRAVAFREALRAWLLANNGDELANETLAILQETAGNVPLRVVYTESGTLELQPSSHDVAGALGKLQAVIFESMLQGTWHRLKACLSDTCQWAFYDASKNRSGTWCSMEVCGNRMKVRSHRHRKSAGRSG
jgi:predicted RNA-binding Zn ribbon-like protein